ncbi:hypothetical protein PHMEG_00020670 [Phytophthora megakarya]|uniref:RxLR effector PexRD54 WY domain-containing protein n=1 Tax=Phytophthora megakarya TaxID=4795 RepID=A0A225VQD1_9STRA|nr:hypothetical protein PHMEG_00020670 [Phytophthora megakarya]
MKPEFVTWVAYVTKVEKDSPYEIVLVKLLTNYSDQRLAPLIFTATQELGTSIAWKLEAAQLEKWLRDRKSPQYVFKLLSLDKKNGVNILNNPALRGWISYVNMSKKDPYELLFKILKVQYTDSDLAHILVMAKQDNRLTSSSETTTMKLEDLLQNHWFQEGRSADYIFQILKMEKDGDNIFNSPMWDFWISYLMLLNKETPEAPTYSVLKTHFGDKRLIKAIENKQTKAMGNKLQEEIWWNEKKTEDDMFKFFKLDADGEKFVENPMLSTWFSYAVKIGKLKEKPNEFFAVEYLEMRFNEMELARTLSKEKHELNEATTKVVSDIQRMEFTKWMASGMDPTRVGMRLRHKSDTTRNLLVNLGFLDFYKANGGSMFFKRIWET